MKKVIKRKKIEVEVTDLGFGNKIEMYAVRSKKDGHIWQYFLYKEKAIEYEREEEDFITKEILWID